ncbi:MAG: TonB-dependent receptor [Steroidobacteraceae bacterium]
MNSWKKERSRAAAATLGTMLGLGWTVDVCAQAADNDGLEEIIVTAEKRATNLQKTAISMVVLSGEEEAKKGSTTLDAVLQSVSSLKLEGHAQGAQIFIRGVGSNMDPTIGDSAVAVSTDGAYNSRSETVLSTLNDVERIEVLRGPQGTLYGRNATGGQVNIVTADPKLDKFEANARLGGGNYSLFSASGVVNVPLSGSTALRGSFTREKHAGYLTDGNLDNDTWSIRLKGLYQPNDVLRVVPTVEYYQFKGSNIATVYNLKDRVEPNYSTDPWWDPFNKGNSGTQNVNVNLHTEVLTGIGKLTLTPTFSHQRRCQGVFLFAAPGLNPFAAPVNHVLSGQLDVDCGGAIGASGGGGPPSGVAKQDEYTLEARMNSLDSSRIKWTVGVFGYQLKATTNALNIANLTVPTVTPACGTYSSSTVDCVVFAENSRPVKSYALFSQVTYPLTDAFRLVAGGRYNRDNRQSKYSLVDFSQSTTDPTITERTAGSSSAPATWKAGAELDVGPSAMLYATISTGFKSGGVSQDIVERNGSLYAGTYKPERLLAYEVGSKNRFFGDRLQLNGSVYLYRYSNFQVQYGGANSASGSFCNCVQNADTGTMKGVEAELQWLIDRADRLDISASGEDAHYGRLIIPNLSLPPASTESGAPYTGPYDLSGHDMANAPKWTVSLGYQHSWNLSSGKVTLRGDAKASAGYWSTVEVYFKNVYQDAYQNYDATLSYESSDESWSVNAWGKNLANDVQVTYSMPFGRQMISNPRTYGVTAFKRF